MKFKKILRKQLIYSFKNSIDQKFKKKMLISDSLRSKFSREYIEGITTSHVQLNYGFKNPKLSLDSLLISFLENLEKFSNTSCYQKDLTGYLTSSNIIDFLTALHSIILNEEFINFRSNALYSFAHALKSIRDMNLLFSCGFFTKDIIEFYSQILFECDKETELFSLSIINSILFDNFEDSQSLLLEYELPILLLEEESEFISPLFVPFSKAATPENMNCLYQNGFIEAFLKKLLNNVSSKGNSIETASNAMESTIILLQNQNDDQENDFDFLQSELVLNLYSDDDRCIVLALKLMIMLDLPPLGCFDILCTFLMSRRMEITIETINLIVKFSSILDQEEQNELKDAFLNMLSDQPFKIEYQCVMALLSSSFFSILNIDEKKYILETLIIYLSDDELHEESLKGIIILFQDESEENSKLIEIILREITIFEDLSWSENKNVVKFAEQILSLVEESSDNM